MRRVVVLGCCALAGCAPETPEPPNGAAQSFVGTWSGPLTTPQHELWQVEDFTVCLLGCTPAARAHFAALVDDAANDGRPVRELVEATMVFAREELAKKSLPEGVAIQALSSEGAGDPTFRCLPHGLARAALNPFPMELRQEGTTLTITYEQSNQSRTIHMDGRARPARELPTPLGHSTGRYDGATLVVETTGVEPSRYYDSHGGGGHSAEARFVERYVVAEEPRRLELQMTITDPVTLLEPHVVRKTWLATAEARVDADACGDEPDRVLEESALERLRNRRG